MPIYTTDNKTLINLYNDMMIIKDIEEYIIYIYTSMINEGKIIVENDGYNTFNYYKLYDGKPKGFTKNNVIKANNYIIKTLLKFKLKDFERYCILISHITGNSIEIKDKQYFNIESLIHMNKFNHFNKYKQVKKYLKHLLKEEEKNKT